MTRAEPIPKGESAKAFKEAIAAGHFSLDKEDTVWVGHFMYSGIDLSGTYLFWHTDTLLYYNWQPPLEDAPF